MSALQRKIKTLESTMNHNTRCADENWDILAHYAPSMRFIIIGGTLSFVVGMVIGYKQNLRKLTRSLIFITKLMTTYYR